MPPSNTRHLDEICRIYKNSANQIIGIQDIAIRINSVKLNQKEPRYHRSIDGVIVSTTRINQDVLQDRTIATILQIGHYDSVNSNNGNYNEIKYLAETEESNTIEISLSIYTKQIGDTI